MKTKKEISKEDFKKYQSEVIRSSHNSLKYISVQLIKAGMDPVKFLAIYMSEVVKIEREYYVKLNELKEKDKKNK